MALVTFSQWTTKTEKRMELIAKESIQRVIEESQKPVAKGGNMRVDTGFLRNSGVAQIGGLPSGPNKNPFKDPNSAPVWDNSSAAVTINRLKLGQTLFFGWTANYAIHRENQDAFVRRAVQNWQQIVNEVTAEAKAVIK